MNPTSVKDRLRNIARSKGMIFDDVLKMYALERAIYRISISPYADKFVLKGGILLYALYDGDYPRATTDIDLSAHHLSNNAEYIQRVFEEILQIKCDDAIRFDNSTLQVCNITEFKEYHGVNVSFTGYLDRTRIRVSIDVGFGDVVYLGGLRINFPVLLDSNLPSVNSYPPESIIAEKFEAIVSLGYLSTRFKDFYDIYVLSHTRNFNGSDLVEALVATFNHRKTEFSEIAAFEPEFYDNAIAKQRWSTFIKKKKASLDLKFDDVSKSICSFLLPVAESIKNGVPFEKKWDCKSQNWK